jgi:ABC-type antimicrobial peptide transport system permease subunit
VYIYEAMAVIMASVALGFIVGSAVAITLTLQADLFSELPFQMHFPTVLFFSILIMSLVVSVFGSYIPANALRNKKIASALKGL